MACKKTFFSLTHLRRSAVEKNIYLYGTNQGDQIGRIVARWATSYLRQFFLIVEASQLLGYFFQSYVLIFAKIVVLHFGTSPPPPKKNHLITLKPKAKAQHIEIIYLIVYQCLFFKQDKRGKQGFQLTRIYTPTKFK
jgi:hypothetical protein